VLAERPRLAAGRTVAALRRGREVMADLEGQLGDLLRCLRTPGAKIDGMAANRLASATSEASSAMSALGALGQLVG
jgi:hypothetical protein